MKKFRVYIISVCLVLLMCVPVFATDPAIIQDQDLRLVGVEETRTTVSASDANGLKAILLEMIGDYETVVTDYTYQSGTSGYYTHSISIEKDYAWIWSCITLIVGLYSVFRVIGGIICR